MELIKNVDPQDYMFKLQREKVVPTAMHHSALHTQTDKSLKKKKKSVSPCVTQCCSSGSCCRMARTAERQSTEIQGHLHQGITKLVLQLLKYPALLH